MLPKFVDLCFLLVSKKAKLLLFRIMPLLQVSYSSIPETTHLWPNFISSSISLTSSATPHLLVPQAGHFFRLLLQFTNSIFSHILICLTHLYRVFNFNIVSTSESSTWIILLLCFSLLICILLCITSNAHTLVYTLHPIIQYLQAVGHLIMLTLPLRGVYILFFFF